MSPEEHLAVPYVLVMESFPAADGRWRRRASYPELPGLVVEADSPIDAVEQIEQLRVQLILERLRRGEEVPVPRPPLQSILASRHPHGAARANRHR